MLCEAAVKKLGKRMPESVAREELESLKIHVHGFMHLRSGRRNQDPTKDRPPTPHSIVSVARGPKGPIYHPGRQSARGGRDVLVAKGTTAM
jgi:hypothetical protein